MNINDFENNLPASISVRGREYHEAGAVQQLCCEGHKWSARVKGSQSYIIGLQLKNGEISGWSCDCPYDYGAICKHIAAVLFAIRGKACSSESGQSACLTFCRLVDEAGHERLAAFLKENYRDFDGLEKALTDYLSKAPAL